MPSLSRELREGDVFEYTNMVGETVNYKIETVKYKIEQSNSPGNMNNIVVWSKQRVYYGVSVEA